MVDDKETAKVLMETLKTNQDWRKVLQETLDEEKYGDLRTQGCPIEFAVSALKSEVIGDFVETLLERWNGE